MQQLLAAASIAASLLLVCVSIGTGWVLLWYAALKDIGFFRDLLGVNRPSPEQRAQRRAAAEAEIERLRRQHSRGTAGRAQRSGAAGSAAAPRSEGAGNKQQPAAASQLHHRTPRLAEAAVT